jgi:dolichyl-diphosphooligosaccharide--protein glycosyltransferase
MGSKRKAPGETRKKPGRRDDVKKDDAGKGKPIVRPTFPLKLDRTAALLSAVLLLALAIRLLPLTFDISGGHVIFSEFDPYYHMRRIVYTVAHFPFVNGFDSYVNYPYGYGISWPPLFDLIAASLSLIVGLGSPGRFTVEVVSAAVPVILGLLSILLLYYIVKDALGKNAALLASLFMAILPAASFRTSFGFTDHHALEVFISLAMYLCFTRAVTYAGEDKLSLKRLARRPLAYAVLAGTAMAGMVFSWDGAPIFISVIVVYAFAQYAYDAFRREDTEYLTIIGAAASLVAAAIVMPFVMAGPAGQQFAISAIYLSWFHIIYLLAVALFFVVMGGLSRAYAGMKAPWFSTVLTAAIGMALLLVAARFALPQFFEALEAGIEFLMGQGNVLVTIVEVEPLFSNNGQFSYEIPWVYLSTGGLLAVLGLIVYLLTRQWKGLKNAEAFLLVWTLIVLALGLLQKRFIYLLAVNVAVFAGFAIYKALDMAGFFQVLDDGKADSRRRSQHSREASITPPVVAVVIVSAVAVLGIMISPVALPTSPDALGDWYAHDWDQACQWVNDHTPETSYAYSADNGTHPEYGVMCWWDYGNFILYRAERPAVANNFQTGVADAAHFFVAQDEASASAIMDKRNAKYVMVDYRMGSPWGGVANGVFENMPYLAGEDPDSYHMSYLMPVPYGSKRMIDSSDKYYGSMYSRLFNADGLGGRDGLGYDANGLQRYRLIYATQGNDPVKVFEYVKGATIKGMASPGARLELRIDVAMPEANSTYRSSTTADQAGAYTFTVPYPTSWAAGIVTTGPAYTISSGTSSVEVQVPATAADRGEAVTAGGLR